MNGVDVKVIESEDKKKIAFEGIGTYRRVDGKIALQDQKQNQLQQIQLFLLIKPVLSQLPNVLDVTKLSNKIINKST